MRIIDVDHNGRDADGLSYDQAATPEAIRAGFVCEEHVKLRYPDGKVVRAKEVRITQKGLAALQREMPVGLREPQGVA